MPHTQQCWLTGVNKDACHTCSRSFTAYLSTGLITTCARLKGFPRLSQRQSKAFQLSCGWPTKQAGSQHRTRQHTTQMDQTWLEAWGKICPKSEPQKSVKEIHLWSKPWERKASHLDKVPTTVRQQQPSSATELTVIAWSSVRAGAEAEGWQNTRLSISFPDKQGKSLTEKSRSQLTDECTSGKQQARHIKAHYKKNANMKTNYNCVI